MLAVDFTNKTGTDLANFISDKTFKYGINITSKAYNSSGAYLAFENTYIKDDKLLESLVHSDDLLKNLYASYYNNVKPYTEKTFQPNMPKTITADNIKCISIRKLDANYCPYYAR